MRVTPVNLHHIVFESWRVPFARGNAISGGDKSPTVTFERINKEWKTALEAWTAGDLLATRLRAAARSHAAVGNREGGVLKARKQIDIAPLDALVSGSQSTALAAVKDGNIALIATTCFISK